MYNLKMFLKVIQTIVLLLIVCVWSFDEVFGVPGNGHEEMLEKGKMQYQLLQERGKLPKYGSCWLQAVENIEEGCRALTEETQSDIALHLTNCFLEMSGHDTYNCNSDKKHNVRGICISSMSDRAFHVYTEFYTHTQNICWFLRGQMWHETISENTFKVGKQLEQSAKNQDNLLKNQEESLQIQERILNYGQSLEVILHGFLMQAEQHKELLGGLSRNLAGLQNFIMSEISWFDTIVFYLGSIFMIMFFTSNARTYSARLPVFLLLACSMMVERSLTRLTAHDLPRDIGIASMNYYSYVWLVRYVFITVSVALILLSVYFYKDYNCENNKILLRLQTQLTDFTSLDKKSLDSPTISCDRTPDRYLEKSVSTTVSAFINNEFERSYLISDVNTENGLHTPVHKANVSLSRNLSSARKKLQPVFNLQNNVGYNLRSRQNTPDSSFQRA